MTSPLEQERALLIISLRRNQDIKLPHAYTNISCDVGNTSAQGIFTQGLRDVVKETTVAEAAVHKSCLMPVCVIRSPDL